MAMLSCQEITRRVASGEYDHAGRWGRFTLWLHRTMCRSCDRYVRQIRDLGAGARAHLAEADEPSRHRVEQSLVKHIRGDDS